MKLGTRACSTSFQLNDLFVQTDTAVLKYTIPLLKPPFPVSCSLTLPCSTETQPYFHVSRSLTLGTQYIAYRIVVIRKRVKPALNSETPYWDSLAPPSFLLPFLSDTCLAPPGVKGWTEPGSRNLWGVLWLLGSGKKIVVLVECEWNDLWTPSPGHQTHDQ